MDPTLLMSEYSSIVLDPYLKFKIKSVDLTRVLNAFGFTSCEHLFRSRLISSKVLFTLEVMLSMWVSI